MKKKVIDIDDVPYGVGEILCEPTNDEIKKAIRENDLETRSFQNDLKELNDEWNRNARNENEYYALQKQYHARRIAYFVVKGWNDPILFHRDGFKIKDGLHRFKAAIYKGMDTIDVDVNDIPA